MDIEPRGGRSEGVGAFFKSSDAGGVVVRGGDVGANPQDGAGPWQFPKQVRATDRREASEETGG